MDGGTAKQGRGILNNGGKRHHRMRVLCRGMSEPFQSGEGIMDRKIQHALMRLDDLEIEGGHLVKKLLGGSKPGRMLRLVLDGLPNGGGRLGHGLCLLIGGNSFLLSVAHLERNFNNRARAQADHRLTTAVETAWLAAGSSPLLSFRFDIGQVYHSLVRLYTCPDHMLASHEGIPAEFSLSL